MMKKIPFFSLFIFSLSLVLYTTTVCDECGQKAETENPCFTVALTSGYVFKHEDCTFKKVYGHGIPNILTVDACYYPFEWWGMGAKASYWRAKGRTTFFKQHTYLREVPLTFYLRKILYNWRGLQTYASLGGGVLCIKEKSYLGCVRLHKGIGEFELGLNYPNWRSFNITGAFRYLFPREFICRQKSDIGGFDLRAGIGFSY